MQNGGCFEWDYLIQTDTRRLKPAATFSGINQERLGEVEKFILENC